MTTRLMLLGLVLLTGCVTVTEPTEPERVEYTCRDPFITGPMLSDYEAKNAVPIPEEELFDASLFGEVENEYKRRWIKKDLEYWFDDSVPATGFYRTQARRAAAQWTRVSAFTLTETQDKATADILISHKEMQEYWGWGMYPRIPVSAGDGRWYQGPVTAVLASNVPALMTIGWFYYVTMLHELGHNLGLSHAEAIRLLDVMHNPGSIGLTNNAANRLASMYGVRR